MYLLGKEVGKDELEGLQLLRLSAEQGHGRAQGQLPLSLRNVEDLLHERGIDISHETVRFWWNRFGHISSSRTS